jgi:hypothetical protein
MNLALPSPAQPLDELLPSQVSAEFVYHDRVAPAAVSLVEHGKRDRVLRAIRALAACWGAAIAAVFVPVLHFVLVPALLLGGPLFAMARWRERVTVMGADGNCPACGTPQHPRPRAAAAEHMGFRCEGCRRALELRLPSELLAR